jgi:hypothetical protein
MKTIKTPKNIHNRPSYGEWNYSDKETRKRCRKLFKAVRHKLLFHIPLSDEEEEYRRKHNIKEDTKMTFEGESDYSNRESTKVFNLRTHSYKFYDVEYYTNTWDLRKSIIHAANPKMAKIIITERFPNFKEIIKITEHKF